jgi:hypothetical protein
MSFAAAFIIIAQSAATGSGGDAPAARTAPVAERVTVSARVLRPARISFLVADGETTEEDRNRAVQRGRDNAGTVWIEFS